MTNRTNADFLQVLLGQVREDPFVDLVVAESRLVFFEAQAPQPDHDVHDGAHNQWWRTSSAWEARVSRVALGLIRCAKPSEVKRQWPVFNPF